MAPLRALFPNIHTKESLGSKEELAEFSAYSSRMAALDFIVCYQSDVFVSNNNGNMAKILGGRRRYFGGQKPTIRPNAKKLNRLLVKRNKMRWEEFASQVRTFQIGFMGEMEIETGGSGSSLFHENPLSCICTNSTENKSTRRRYDDEDDLLFLEDLSGYDDDDDDGIPRRLDGGRN
ncbi:UNVERIFIED_CONTAM: O-fucosyltransferase 6 [Sesamum calycinum]|uniref:O-fucosyltransferase family protein n=1 Tax=Sesamum calycinum TaxID=2727403 RepID=A0AAW2JN66_9LAMI